MRTLALCLSALVGTLLACELVLRLLPVSTATLTGYANDPMLLTYPPHHEWTVATGWDLRNVQHLESNNAGYAADHDFVRDPNAVALIGDSYVEASMLDRADRPAAQLELDIGNRRPVYAMGAPGSSLLDYAERIRWATQRFGVRDVVLLMERGDVWQSICGSGNVHAACLDPKTLAPRIDKLPDAGTLKQWVRKSALAQYIVSQLKLSPSTLIRDAIAQSRPPEPPKATKAAAAPIVSPEALHRVDVVTDRFFERIDGSVTGRLVIVLDSDRTKLFRHQPIADPERDRFIEQARRHGAIVVDTQPIYAAHFERSPLRLDVGPYDGHLNPLGVKLAMGAAAEALAKP